MIEVKKDNYVSWQKTLEVAPGQTTFAEEIALFLSDRPKIDLGLGSENYLINKNQDKYIYLVANELILVNTETAKNFSIFEFTAPIKLVDWSPDDQNLLILQNNQYKIFDISTHNTKILTVKNPDKIIWDNNDNNAVWYLSDRKIYRYNIVLDNTTEKPMTADDFALTGDFIATQSITDSSSQIIQYHKETNEEIRTIADLNLGKLNLLLADNNNLIFILGSKLYIKRQTEELITFLATQVKIYNRYLLISDNHEILLYDYQTDWKDILERSSEIVADIVWHPNSSYYLNEINGVATLFELDGRDHRNKIELLNNPLKKMYLFSRRGDKLFVLTPEENFYIQIQ